MLEVYAFSALLAIVLLMYINFAVFSLGFFFVMAVVFLFMAPKIQPVAKPRGINLMEIPRPQVKSTVEKSTQKSEWIDTSKG